MFDPKQYRNGMYSERETMDEALNYAYGIAKSTGFPASVTTAVHVVLNTMIDMMTKPQQPRTLAELEAESTEGFKND